MVVAGLEFRPELLDDLVVPGNLLGRPIETLDPRLVLNFFEDALRVVRTEDRITDPIE